ncbi:hypothetical protein SOVF_105400, partial [Spinacia oleracea]
VNSIYIAKNSLHCQIFIPRLTQTFPFLLPSSRCTAVLLAPFISTSPVAACSVLGSPFFAPCSGLGSVLGSVQLLRPWLRSIAPSLASFLALLFAPFSFLASVLALPFSCTFVALAPPSLLHRRSSCTATVVAYALFFERYDSTWS